MVEAPISWGEVIDKITILQIKMERMTDAAKVANVQREHTLLMGKCAAILADETVTRLTADLKKINEALWDIEDEIRDWERRKDFGPRFIELARSVYITNDERAAVKKEINLHLSSELVEEKSYAAYK